MGPTLYEWMTAGQADEAMACFLAERAPALQRVREVLAEHGRDADSLLDGTTGSVAGVWEWTTERCTELGTDPRTLDEDPTREQWPSWARHGMLVDPHPPAGALVLVDGFVSYLAEVIAAAVPDVHWRIGEHRLSDYPMLNRPVLAGEHHQIFLPALPLYSVYQAAHGRTPMDGHEMLEHTERTICALRGESPDAAAAEETLVTVVAEVGCFDVGLREDLPDRHGTLLDRMVVELADRDGVVSVHRYGPAALVVDVPTWDELRLRMWLTLWLQRHLPR